MNSTRAPIAAALGFAAMALIIAAPALGDPRHLALGHPGADTWNHVWGFGQVYEALLAGRSPLQTHAVGHPDGGALWFIDMFSACLTLPIQAALGPVAAYNSAVVFNVWLAGFGGWALARALSGPRVALLGGVAFMLQPQLLAQLHNGISETLAVGWLPLCALAMLHLHRTPSRRNALLAGGCLAICGLANWYYGLFAGLAAVGLAINALRPSARGALTRKQLTWAVLAASPLLPALWLFRETLRAPDALVQRDPTFVMASLTGHNMVDLLAFIHPSRSLTPDLLGLFDEHLQIVVYIGWALLGPALWAVSRRREARPWAAAALVCFVFALGPYLYVAGDFVLLPSGDRLPLPFLALFELLPVFSPISHAFRFAIPLQVCLIAMAAIGLRGRPALALAASVLFAVEALVIAPVDFPVPAGRAETPAVYAELPADGAVLDLPVSVQVLRRSRYNLYQLDHGRPLPYGFNDPTPDLLDANPLTRSIIDLERSAVDSRAPTPPLLELALGRRLLAADGISSIVVHSDLYPPGLRESVLGQLELALGPGHTVGDAVWFPVTP